jgi:hypothetical protein
MKVNTNDVPQVLVTGVLAFLMVVGWLSIGFALGAWLWTYSLNEWLVFLDKAPVVVWWQGGLLGFCPWIGKWCIPIAVVTWVLMLML